MTKRSRLAILALALLVAFPLDAAFAGRGGGGGGGGGFGGGDGGGDRGGGFGGGNRGIGDGGRGSVSYSRPQNENQQRLFDAARKDCNGPKYPSGATPRIDYASNSYTCFEGGSTRR